MKRIDVARSHRYLCAKDGTMPDQPVGLRAPDRHPPSTGRSIFASGLFSQSLIDALTAEPALTAWDQVRRVALHPTGYVPDIVEPRRVTDVVIRNGEVL